MSVFGYYPKKRFRHGRSESGGSGILRMMRLGGYRGLYIDPVRPNGGRGNG
jgi:hypothetical protein